MNGRYSLVLHKVENGCWLLLMVGLELKKSVKTKYISVSRTKIRYCSLINPCCCFFFCTQFMRFQSALFR